MLTMPAILRATRGAAPGGRAEGAPGAGRAPGAALRRGLRRGGSVAVVAALWAVACASSPAPHFYTLTPTLAPSALSEDGVAVVVGPFRLPDYLDRPQMATRGKGGVLELDEFDRWAEPLRTAFTRVVAVELGRALGSARVSTLFAGSGLPSDYRLVGDVRRFEADRALGVVLEVQWMLRDAEQNPRIGPAVWRQEISVDGRSRRDEVEAMRSVLAAFAAEVAQRVREIAAERTPPGSEAPRSEAAP